MNTIAADITDARATWNNAAAHACAPRKRLTVSQWADAHRVLSPKASSMPGPWRTSRVPFVREIMDCLSTRSPVTDVVFMKSTQTAGTEVGLNWLGYAMHQTPSPMLVVVPTIEVRRRWTLQRLNPMLAESPVLADLYGRMRTRDARQSQDIKDFPGGGMLVLGGANSPASLASMPIRFVLADEVDRFKWEIGGEGDPLGLVAQRQKTFARRKTFLVSTPTIRGASRIEQRYEASDKRRYMMPCPHCGDKLRFQWSGLQWSKESGDAWYVCPHCGCMIDEHAKRGMLAAGEWVPERPGQPVRGYHINALYAPPGLGMTWKELVADWYHSKDDRTKLQRFVNTQLGETWEDRSRDVDTISLQHRAEPYAVREVPPSCLLLTAGVDVQDNRLAVEIVGWGEGERAWIIDWVELMGSPALQATWTQLTDLLNRGIDNRFGQKLAVEATAIDTGGHHTHDVYNYVRRKEIRRPMAIKGSNTPNQAILAGRPRSVDVNQRGKTIRHGVQLWAVGSDTAKHWLINRLVADGQLAETERNIHFPKSLEEEFYKQLTGKLFNPEKNRWVSRRGRRAEAMDCFSYALAASQNPQIRVHRMRPADWRRLQSILEPGNEIAPAAADEITHAPDAQHKPAAAQSSRRRPRQQPTDTGFGSDGWNL